MNPHRLATLRPWSEFGSSQNFSKPKTLAEVSGRLAKNIRYFATNYTLVFLSLLAYCLITSPLLLFAVIFALGGAAAILHFKEKDTQVIVGGKTLGVREQIAALVGVSIPLFWIASAGSVVFWLLGMLGRVSILLTCYLTMFRGYRDSEAAG